MTFDLALSDDYDLIVSASRDLAGISGDILAGQRIRTRLRIERGAWVLNENIGSILTSSLSRLTSETLAKIPPIIMDALRNVNDVEIVDVQVTQTSPTEVLAIIEYRNVATSENLPVSTGTYITSVPLGIAGGE